jgi:hypothetical protein
VPEQLDASVPVAVTPALPGSPCHSFQGAHVDVLNDVHELGLVIVARVGADGVYAVACAAAGEASRTTANGVARPRTRAKAMMPFPMRVPLTRVATRCITVCPFRQSPRLVVVFLQHR